MVTTGATEALAATFFGLIEPDGEVVLIEPCYDCYMPIIQRAGGICRPVQFRPPAWKLDTAPSPRRSATRPNSWSLTRRKTQPQKSIAPPN